MTTLKALLLSAIAIATLSNAGEISDRVEKTKTLIVGTEGTYAPFNFHDKDNKLVGFDIDVITEVGKRLGLTVEFKETIWDAMFAGLNAKRFDLIADQVGSNEERRKKYDFSDPYNYDRVAIVTKADNNDFKTFADLKGKKAAQNLTTTYNKTAKENGAEVVVADSLVQILELVRQGRVDAAVNSQLAILAYLDKNPKAQLKVAVKADSKEGIHFITLQNEEPLLEKINEAIAEMRVDGTLTKISLKWFSDDITQ